MLVMMKLWMFARRDPSQKSQAKKPKPHRDTKAEKGLPSLTGLGLAIPVCGRRSW